MPIRTEIMDFDREKAGGRSTTENPTDGAMPATGVHNDSESGNPRQGWHRTNGPGEARAFFRFILGDRQIRLDQARPMRNRPPSTVLTDGDRAVVGTESRQGHDQLVRTDDLRSATPPGEELSRRMGRDLQGDGAVAFPAEFSGASPALSEPRVQRIPGPDTSGKTGSPAGPYVPDQPDETTVPMTLLDRRFPRRGWEQEYGVPSYLVGAADVLYFHRRHAASPDVAVIDAAILRLYWPWIRRGTASSPIPQESER